MAAAIIPVVATAVGAIGPQIPAMVQFVETLFGHSAQTTKQDGAAKLETAVTLLQNTLAALANAGKIPSAAVVDPSLPAGLTGAVQQAVDTLKAAGQLGPATAPGVPAQVTPAPKTAISQTTLTTGTKVVITGVMAAG